MLTSNNKNTHSKDIPTPKETSLDMDTTFPWYLEFTPNYYVIASSNDH